jgi:hypothetical protein
MYYFVTIKFLTIPTPEHLPAHCQECDSKESDDAFCKNSLGTYYANTAAIIYYLKQQRCIVKPKKRKNAHSASTNEQ